VAIQTQKTQVSAVTDEPRDANVLQTKVEAQCDKFVTKLN